MPKQLFPSHGDVRPLLRSDWTWIKKWFQDQWLNSALGPMDEEWLDYVLADRNGVELVVTRKGQPIGLVGIVWATSEQAFHCVTDLAVDPALRRQGLGCRILEAAMRWPGHPPASTWRAYVAQDNDPPARLLQSLGWTETNTQNDMRTFSTQVKSGLEADV